MPIPENDGDAKMMLIFGQFLPSGVFAVNARRASRRADFANLRNFREIAKKRGGARSRGMG
jgi:hypothetical protein